MSADVLIGNGVNVVGLFGYLVKGVHDEGVPVDISLATALFVPVAVLFIWWMVRRIRRRHIVGADESSQ